MADNAEKMVQNLRELRLDDMAASSSFSKAQVLPKKPNRRPWPGSVKQSAFVFLFHNTKIYAVRNRGGKLGVPGGKRDPDDRSIWNTAGREFREESGSPLPGGIFHYFEWGTPRHSIRIYYRRLDSAAASALPLGPSSDPDGEEVETLWAAWESGDKSAQRADFRPHIAQGFAIFDAMVAGSRQWPAQPF